ncbi:MAG: DEAD/DEAH box helicase, partial [Candidatus Andersenbacteria bacterium]
LTLEPKKLALSLPENLLPMLASTLSGKISIAIGLMGLASDQEIAAQWGIQHLINDVLSEQELDGIISTRLSLSMHAFLSNASGSYFIPESMLDIAIPSHSEYQRSILHITTGQNYVLSDFIKNLVKIGYIRHTKKTADFGFVVIGDEVHINHPAQEDLIIISFFGNRIDAIKIRQNNRPKNAQSAVILPMQFPKKQEELQQALEKFIIITSKNLGLVCKTIVLTSEKNPDIALPERLQEIQMPVIPGIKKESAKIYASPISTERALELIGALTPGKPAVHADHGIGIFEGLEKRNLAGTTQEYIILRYADGDSISVPVAFAHKVSPYIGESTPALYKLGGTLWQKTKKKAQHDARAFAKELTAINMQRESAKRNAYYIDTILEQALTASFPFEMTPDQAVTWQDIQTDMQKDIPMDRLVVGDVGFGKTELAMRAARHAFANGKQIALLAPTTLLVQQHADTFRERLQDIKDSIFLISRFSSNKEINTAKKAISENKPVIIIGTHAILSHTMPWQNLSLLIIDEEQRFGVKQKEHLKKMRSTIDVLSLSATPIPRTLSMALSGLRSLSVIATAPKGRKNIETSIKKVSDETLRHALFQELDRDGQLYIVAPKIRMLSMIKETIQALAPHARIAIAHAKLPDDQLSHIVHAFDTHKLDILISSSIVENGLDLPNANTMIVWNAPHFGLAQLYQLRGRIGRRSRQGHALFLYSQEKLTDMQRERLTALTESSRQGSGWDIARRDLELRGAGNILGAEQSGSASAVGMYMYLDMVDGTQEEARADIHTLLPAYIPASYISDADTRTMWYIRLSRAKSSQQLQEYLNTLEQQFNKAPEEVENLIKMILLEKTATKNQISSIQTKVITPNDEDPYVRILVTGKDPVKILEKLSNIKNANNTDSRWQVRESTLSWDLDAITPGVIDQLISSLDTK